MAISATLSLYGIYRLYPQLFDDMVLPAGIDKEILVDNLIIEAEALEILYPNPEFFAEAIAVWSRKRLPVWDHMWQTENYQYDPIANYDRTETITETIDSSGRTSSSTTGTNTAVNSATAYNSNTFADVAKAVADGSDTSTGESTGKSTRGQSIRAFGNIGTVTTQHMIEAERNVAKFNTTDFIINDFMDRFCIGIY